MHGLLNGDVYRSVGELSFGLGIEELPQQEQHPVAEAKRDLEFRQGRVPDRLLPRQVLCLKCLLPRNGKLHAQRAEFLSKFKL